MSVQEVQRFPRNFPWIHGIVILTVTVCLITGLPLRWEWWSVTTALGGYNSVKWIHRLSGCFLVGTCIIFIFNAISGEMADEFKDFRKEMMPNKSDLTEFVQEMKFLLGLSPERPRIGKFSWNHKIEFWAAAWGVVIMTLTGLVLWYPRSFGGIIIETSHVIHSWEALLTLIAIYVLHIYHVHLHHGKPRLNRIWLTGKIPVDELKIEHPAEYDALVEKGEIPPEGEE